MSSEPEAGPPRRGIPVPPGVTVFAALLALGFGGGIGSSLGPGVETLLAATPAATAPGAQAVASTAAGGGEAGGVSAGSGGGSSSAPASPTPATTTPLVPTVPVPTTPLPDDAPPDEVPEEDPPAADPIDEDPLPDDSVAVNGVAIRVNPIAGSYTLASGGALTTVHAKELPDPGMTIDALVVPLFNGTFSEAEERKETRPADAASFSGTVTFRDEEGLFYVLSSAGASVPVRVSAPAGGKDPDMPELSASVTVEVELDPKADALAPAEDAGAEAATETEADPDACVAEEAYPAEAVDPGVALVQSSYNVDFETLAFTGLAGVVQAVCPDLGQVLISSDDLRESGQDLVLSVPKDVNPSKLAPGDPITVNVDPSPADDGTIGLTGLASDEGIKGADDAKAGLGDKG